MGALLCPVMEAERNRKRKASSSFLARILPVKCYGAGTSLVVQWLSLHLLMQRVQVRSPVGELGSPTPCLMAQNPKHKQKPSRNEFNKHFENGPHTYTHTHACLCTCLCSQLPLPSIKAHLSFALWRLTHTTQHAYRPQTVILS